MITHQAGEAQKHCRCPYPVEDSFGNYCNDGDNIVENNGWWWCRSQQQEK
jgi:hypothetical protein